MDEMRSIENVVRAILREAGLKLGTPGRAAFAARVRELAGDDPLVMPLVDPLLTVLATMLTALARLTKQVMDLVKKETVCRRLMSVPGVGPSPRSPSGRRSTGRIGSSARATSAPISAYTGALSVGRDRHPGQDQPLRRRTRSHRAL
jgi:hypothetical protein